MARRVLDWRFASCSLRAIPGQSCLHCDRGAEECLTWPPKKFGVYSSIRFTLDSLRVHYDTLRYSGMYRLMSYEDLKIHSVHHLMGNKWSSFIFGFSFFEFGFWIFSWNPYFIWNLRRFHFDESLYEPSRQWLGWQFTGGPKLDCTTSENFTSKFSKILVFYIHIQKIMLWIFESILGHLWMLEKSSSFIFETVFLFRTFDILKFSKNAWFEILNHFRFNQSLYEPFR